MYLFHIGMFRLYRLKTYSRALSVAMGEFPARHKPGIVIFDMDYTVWPYWADCHLDPPFSECNGAYEADSITFSTMFTFCNLFITLTLSVHLITK